MRRRNMRRAPVWVKDWMFVLIVLALVLLGLAWIDWTNGGPFWTT